MSSQNQREHGAGLTFLAVAIALPVSWFLWTVLHEVSHLAVVAVRRKVTSVKFKLYPHRDAGHWRFASVAYEYVTPELNHVEEAAMLLAPRVLDALGLVTAVALASVGSSFWTTLAMWVAGGSVVDLFVGSVGSSPQSDARRAADAIDVSVWWFRIPGLAVAIVTGAWAFIAWWGHVS